jgi:hypothetical protein
MDVTCSSETSVDLFRTRRCLFQKTEPLNFSSVAEIRLWCCINDKLVLRMQVNFCVGEFCVTELIIIIEITGPTQPTVKSRRLWSVALESILNYNSRFDTYYSYFAREVCEGKRELYSNVPATDSVQSVHCNRLHLKYLRADITTLVGNLIEEMSCLSSDLQRGLECGYFGSLRRFEAVTSNFLAITQQSKLAVANRWFAIKWWWSVEKFGHYLQLLCLLYCFIILYYSNKQQQISH